MDKNHLKSTSYGHKKLPFRWELLFISQKRGFISRIHQLLAKIGNLLAELDDL